MANRYQFKLRNGKSYITETYLDLPRALSQFCRRHGLIMEKDIIGIKVLNREISPAYEARLEAMRRENDAYWQKILGFNR